MKPAIVQPASTLIDPPSRAAGGWPRLLIVWAVVLLPLLFYAGTALSIEEIWYRSETYAHGYLVLPISLWLVWRQRDRLAALPMQPYWPALAVLLLCGAAWMAGVLGDVQVVRQYVLAAMLPTAALAMLGLPMARALAFPLLFVLFGVPVGENLIAPLIQVTAGITVEALRWTGLPVLREGNHISLPSGDWSVVEACSGLRYLVSSFTLGWLYAYLTYRSLWRRALFIVAALLVPVAANGARAYMIVMIGHLSGMKMAVGVDHLIYGWVFFGLVMLVLFWIGNFWREPEAAVVPPPAGAGGVAPRASTARVAAAGLAAACCMGIWPAYMAQLERSGASLAAIELERYQSPQPAAAPFTTWRPDFVQPAASVRRYLELPEGKVGLDLLYYRDRQDGPKLISSANHLTKFEGGWNELGSQVRATALPGLSVRETTLSSAGQSLLVWRCYLIGDSWTGSDYVGKVLQARQKMLTGRSDGVVVMIFSPYNENPETARAALSKFLQDNGALLQRALTGSQKP